MSEREIERLMQEKEQAQVDADTYAPFHVVAPWRVIHEAEGVQVLEGTKVLNPAADVDQHFEAIQRLGAADAQLQALLQAESAKVLEPS